MCVFFACVFCFQFTIKNMILSIFSVPENWNCMQYWIRLKTSCSFVSFVTFKEIVNVTQEIVSVKFILVYHVQEAYSSVAAVVYRYLSYKDFYCCNN